MSRHREYEFDCEFNFLGATPFIQPASQPVAAAMEEDDVALELDEPPDHYYPSSPRPLEPPRPASTPVSAEMSMPIYAKKPPTPMVRTPSLLTEGLTTSALQSARPTPSHSMSRAGSQVSAYSFSSNHGLTSDEGMSSPAHTGSPSPPLPPIVKNGFDVAGAPKPRTIRFAGEKPNASTVKTEAQGETMGEAQPAPRKTCISFACAPSKTSQAPLAPSKPKQTEFIEAPKRESTIRFACDPQPPADTPAKPVTPPRTRPPKADAQTTPKASSIAITQSRKHRGSMSTVTCSVSDGDKSRAPLSNPASPSETRRLEKERLRKLASTRPEDEDWMNEKPKARKPITVTDTLRKEIAIRQLAEVAANEDADDDELDDIVDEDEDYEEDEPATGSNYMAYDEDESDGGHETDDEEGFADSDDDEDDDPDFQFWTTKHSTAATSAESCFPLRPQHHRTISESSFDSAFRLDLDTLAPPPPPRPIRGGSKVSKPIKMRPGTPELPDSTDFVCGTLDEDRPLEDAYLSCLKQRKLEKQGIIPQDLDPSFPTSDPENNVDDDEEDEHTERSASTASDHHFLGGRFDESDVCSSRGRNVTPKNFPVPMRPSPPRLRSPPPKSRFKSPAPCSARRSRCKSPTPRKLFCHSPVRLSSPPPRHLQSPPTSPKGITIKTTGLAQGPALTQTTSLPHTPNPFFVAHVKRLRAAAKKRNANSEGHNRGPVDIKQGLEERKQRRKEHYWRKHCRDHKDKSRRCAPGKGAERMRELGLEMANRNRAYGQKLHLMMSV